MTFNPEPPPSEASPQELRAWSARQFRQLQLAVQEVQVRLRNLEQIADVVQGDEWDRG